MDPRERADALLARAHALRQNVVTPDTATSPMDASSTSRIPRSVIDAAERFDEPDTQSIPSPFAQTESIPSPYQGEDPHTQPVRRPSPHPHAYQGTLGSADLEDEEPQTRSLDGLIPTVQHQTVKRSLSDRLSGLD